MSLFFAAFGIIFIALSVFETYYLHGLMYKGFGGRRFQADRDFFPALINRMGEDAYIKFLMVQTFTGIMAGLALGIMFLIIAFQSL